MDLTHAEDQPAKLSLDSLDASAAKAVEFAAPEQRKDRVQIVVRQSVLNEVYAHGGDSTEIEICGVLVGRVCRDLLGAFVSIDGSIRGAHATSQNAQVTFTAATWEHIHAELEKRSDDSRILGWYHTHPGFGIFLSSMDRFIHDNFFAMPEQVALVYDPIHYEQGLFVWRNGVPTLEPFVVATDVDAKPTPVMTAMASTTSEATAGASMASEAITRIAALERRQRQLLMSIALVLLVALAWPLIALRYFAPQKREPQDQVSGSQPKDHPDHSGTSDAP